MGNYGGYYKGEKKKVKKSKLEEKLNKIPRVVGTPQVEIIGRGKSKGK